MIRKGLWSPDEDEKLRRSISKYVNGSWNDIARKAGLQRCGRSCRQRWLNHLRPGLRKEKFSKEEVKQVMELQSKLGNRWSEIAAQMTGRTDNEVKNLWNTVIKRRRLFLLAKTSPSPTAAEDDLLPPHHHHADSPSRDTASSQSASSSHSSWSLHVSPGPSDMDFCSSLASHVFMDVELSDQLLNSHVPPNINGQDLSHVPTSVINGRDALHVDEYAGRGQLSDHALAREEMVSECSASLSCLVPPSPAFESTLPSVSHDDQALLLPPLSPCLDPDWDSAAKLAHVDTNLSYTPTPPCKSLPLSYNIMESSKATSSFSFTPPQKSSMLDCSAIPECVTLLSKALETPPIIGNGHYLRSFLLPQQCMSMDHESSQDHAPSPHPIIIMNHEDRSYALNLDTSNDAYDCLSPTSSILETSFHHRFEYGTQDIITTLLWNGGYQ